MIIEICPTDDFLSKEYDGFAEDEFNMDEVCNLISQNSEELEVDLGETFEIPEGFYGDIADDGNEYYSPNEMDIDPLNRLESGWYKLDKKIKYNVEHLVIRKVKGQGLEEYL